MLIQELLLYRIIPFETDEKISELLSFFLHRAPTIDSRLARDNPNCGLEKAWEKFIFDCNISSDAFNCYKSFNYVKEENLKKYQLTTTNVINRKSKGFVCYYKNGETADLQCLLRHIRNSIAHGNVFCKTDINRKYFLFDDFNKNNNMTARILLSQTDLIKLKRIISK